MARKTYTDAQKDRIVKFALSKGRGGKSLVMKKFGVSFTALQAWLGGSQPRNVNKRKSKVKIDGRKARRIRTAIKAVKGLEKQATKLRALLSSL